MSFCPKCGRQRRADMRFCGGCGNDFGQPAAGGGTASPAEPAEPATSGPAEPTRWDAPAGQTRLDSPPDARPDQYASWFADPSAAGEASPLRHEPSDQWEAADTVYAKPAQATARTPAYAPPSQPAPGYPPSAPAGPGRRSGGRGTAILVIVVILVVLGAGGGAYALTRSHGRTTAQPPGNPTVTAQASTAAPAVQVPASPVVNASASPTASPSASATPSPTRTGTVQVAPGVTSDSAEPRVEAYLNRYFNSINTQNYSEYNSLLDAQGQQDDSRSSFASGYATTKDSNEVLTGIEDTGSGSLTANVSFTSHQSSADSIDDRACDNWQISLYLVPQGNGYVATAVPPGYHAAHTAC